MHDMLRYAWGSMRQNFVLPAQGCGYDVDVFVAMHHNARQRMQDEYVARLQAIHNSTELWVSSPDQVDAQFATVVSFLTFLAPRAATYDLVVMTRDDFVYDPGSWAVLSTKYARDALNLVSTDCAGHYWDGLHVFAGADIPTYMTGIAQNPNYPAWAHALDQAPVMSSRAIHLWFTGMYGQPDECKPAMGNLDRGDGNGIVERLGNDIFDAAREQGRCCAEPWKEMNFLLDLTRTPGLRSCPVL